MNTFTLQAPIEETIAQEMELVYELADGEVQQILTSKKQDFADLRHCVRAMAYRKHGCAYKHIARAENSLSGAKASRQTIGYSIRRYYEDILPYRGNLARWVEHRYPMEHV